VSAHSAGAYTATLLVMVNVIKGGGRASPTLTSQGTFYTLMTECTPESSGCNSVYSVPVEVTVNIKEETTHKTFVWISSKNLASDEVMYTSENTIKEHEVTYSFFHLVGVHRVNCTAYVTYNVIFLTRTFW
jgi:hypothetical protein